MISFKSFVAAIHEAVLSANDALMSQHMGMLDTYFYEDKDAERQGARSEQVKRGEDRPEQDSDSGTEPILRAKSVMVEYPKQTENGTEFITVHVPLIALVPVSISEIQEVRLDLPFEPIVVGDELQLMFPGDSASRKKRGLGASSRESSLGRLEIIIKPTESSEGLRDIIQGYERAMKAQIPH